MSMENHYGVKFDAYQIKKKLDSSTGEIVEEYKREIRKDKHRFYRGLISIPMFPIIIGIMTSWGLQKSIALSVGVALMYTVLMLTYMSQTVSNYKRYIKEIENNTNWEERIHWLGESKYDEDLGVSWRSFVNNIYEIRKVYFHKDTYKAYIPIQHIRVSKTDPTKIVFEPVPDNYYRIGYFKDKVHRETYKEMVKVKNQITPTFDECIVMLKAESEIVIQNNGLIAPKNTETGKVLSQNTDGALKTIKQLGRQDKELGAVLENITTKELTQLKEENIRLVDKATKGLQQREL